MAGNCMILMSSVGIRDTFPSEALMAVFWRDIRKGLRALSKKGASDIFLSALKTDNLRLLWQTKIIAQRSTMFYGDSESRDSFFCNDRIQSEKNVRF